MTDGAFRRDGTFVSLPEPDPAVLEEAWRRAVLAEFVRQGWLEEDEAAGMLAWLRTGGLITAVIGIVMMPWKLLASSQGYIFTWLVGYSALLGPIGRIPIADYFVLRRRELVVADLYRRGGLYEYQGGVNPAAIAALAAGILPNVPGFLAQAFPSRFPQVDGFWTGIYSYAWFVGFAIAGVVYLAMMRGRAAARQAT